MIKSTSNKFFLTNLILILLAIVADKFWSELGLDDSHNIYIALLGMIIFGISIGGFFIGIKERKIKSKVLIGLIGNAILTLLFLIVFFYIALTMNN